MEFRTIIQALTKVFNTTDVYVKCSCPDFKYRFAHWNIIKNVSVDDSASDPGPGKGIANPNDDKGRGCKHILLVLSNGDWMLKVASVINNYIKYSRDHLQKNYVEYIFPKVFGMKYDKAVQLQLFYQDEESGLLPSDSATISKAIERGFVGKDNRGKFVKGNELRFQKKPTPVEEPQEPEEGEDFEQMTLF
jgi:hypothetical protein